MATGGDQSKEGSVLIDSAQVVSQALSRLHGLFRDRLKDPEGLAFRPGEGWNSVGVLMKHVLYAEQSMLGRRFGGRAVPQVGHDDQFSNEGTDSASLGNLLDQTDALVASVLAEATDASWNAPSEDFRGNPVNAGHWAILAMTHAFHHEGQMAVLDRLRKETAKV